MSFYKPWLSMWTKPTATIRSIVEQNPNYQLPFLATIYGLYSLLSLAQTFAWGNLLSLLPLLILILALSPLWGYFVFSLLSGIIMITGKWVGGKGSFKNIRAAFAWSHVPMILSNFLWIFFVAIFQEALFQGLPQDKTDTLGAYFLITLSLSFLLLSIWTLVLMIQSLAEVQQFSSLRSISNLFLSILVILGIALLIALILTYIRG